MNACSGSVELRHAIRGTEALRSLGYLAVGAYFGIVLIKGQVADWFRIQEMFRLESFHMYGVIGTAIVVAMASVQLLQRIGARASDYQRIAIPVKGVNKGQLYGGILFGFGWAMTGACPGPMFAQFGAGYGIMLVVLASAVAGTWLYGKLQPYVPH
jgi:uncharacterized membrane protein YedE/YeeE